MKILSAEQIYQADTYTIEHEPISSIDLMERAAGRCFNWMDQYFESKVSRVHIFCGTGNNGGDGLVIGRLFFEREVKVFIYVCRTGAGLSPDFEHNYDRIQRKGMKPIWVESIDDLPAMDSDELIIDALFGIGLNRPVTGLIADCIEWINNSKAYVISIDFPSGLYADREVEKGNVIVRADHVLTFQVPKLALLLPDNQEFVNGFSVMDIDLDRQFLAEINTVYEMIDRSMIQQWYRPRKTFSHKGSFGHSLMIGGSFGKIGAVLLATKAALVSGSGLVSAHIPKCGYIPLQSTVPEAMVEVDGENHLEYFNCLKSATVIGVGPGMGVHEKTKKGFVSFLKSNERPLVIDADAINILAEFDELSALIPEGSIVTPHPKEFQRLVGTWKNDYEKLNKLMEFSRQRAIVTVLKGAYTAVCDGKRVFFNPTGNPGLAKGGSGDVLTGIITALRAQSYPPFEAACMGVYLHGDAADSLIRSGKSHESLMASDLLNELSASFKELFDNHGINFDGYQV